MTKVLSIRLTIEEEATMRRQMVLSGDRELGPHIKRVYFGQLHPQEGVLAELRHNSELALHMLGTLAKRSQPVAVQVETNDGERDVELRLLAGIFSMIHASIGKTQQVFIDRYIDPDVVKEFLKAKG